MSHFGNGELVPSGISGNFAEAAEKRFPRMSNPDLGRVAYYSELADRFNNGAVTPDEEAELIQYLQRSVVHDAL
ncbi:hypothetical protein H7142_04025 [Candidatus Saccharibacteria bacterium]|nr:hypothetical protein [Candidatus Saccharibacteria bacterium]